MKRLTIISCTFPNGKVYGYQKYCIKELKKISTTLLILYHGILDLHTKEQWEQEGIRYHNSEKLYDVAMWQEVIVSWYDRHIKNEYDEIILVNDSFFGPIYPFESIFECMEKEKVDFWGITAHGKIPQYNKRGEVIGEWERFLQRYFLVFRSSLLQSNQFIEFWKNLPPFDKYPKTETEFEFVMTSYFENKGYSWSAFCDTSQWENADCRRNMSFLLFEPYKLLKDLSIPIISKQLFYTSKDVELCYNKGDENKKVLQYLRENSKYDTNLIYEYLIDSLNVYDLWSVLGASWILPIQKGDSFQTKQASRKVLFAAHLYYEDMFDEAVNYLAGLPPYVDIFITSCGEIRVKKLQKLCTKNLKRNYQVVNVGNRGREWSALLLYVKNSLKNYEYLGFIHDKKSSQMYYASVGESFNQFLWDNMVSSEDYVEEILELLDDNEKLGMLVPPVVYHGEFWGHATDFWTICFDITKELAAKLKLKCLLDDSKPVMTIGSSFWAKVPALKKLWEYNFCLEDFPEEPVAIDGTMNHAFERILAYVVQDAGYYTGTILNNKWAESDMVNTKVMLRKIMSKLKDIKGVDVTSTFSTIESLNKMSATHRKSPIAITKKT